MLRFSPFLFVQETDRSGAAGSETRGPSLQLCRSCRRARGQGKAQAEPGSAPGFLRQGGIAEQVSPGQLRSGSRVALGAGATAGMSCRGTAGQNRGKISAKSEKTFMRSRPGQIWFLVLPNSERSCFFCLFSHPKALTNPHEMLQQIRCQQI